MYNFTKYINEKSMKKRKEKLDEFIRSEYFEKFLRGIFNMY